MRQAIRIILLSGCILYLSSGNAQTAHNKKIWEVENNLIPYVPVKGFKGWNILDRMRYYKVPGISIAVIHNYKIEWAKGYGLADTLRKNSVTPETMFSAGSISKFVTAVAALKLVEQNTLTLDSPINRYLKSWKISENDFTKKKPITLRMLLSHTAGTSQSSYFGFTPDQRNLPTVVDILKGAPSSESRPVVVNSEPQREFRYSGGGSMIAQLAMTEASDMTFEELMRRTVFNPLKLKNSTFAQPLPEQYARQAAWAYSAASWFKGMPYVYPQQAAAGLYTTPTDLAKVFIDVQKSLVGKGKILSQFMAQAMTTPQINVSSGGYKEQMGIGPFLLQRIDNKSNDGIYFEFTGVNAGFLAYGIASITQGNGVIVMMNSGDDVNGLGKEIRRSVAKTYAWHNFLPEEINPVKLSARELDGYVGRYRKGPDEVIYIKREGDHLVETINDGPVIYCFPVAKDSIVFTDFNVKGWFGRNSDGTVNSLQSEWQEKPMKRMAENEYSPSENLKMKRYDLAKEGFEQMHLNEYQITYLIYELMNKKPMTDLEAVRSLLELAVKQHPNSSIVHSRWGDYYLLVKQKENALKSFSMALELDPTDEIVKEKVRELSRL